MLENFIYAKQKSLFEEKLNNGEVLDEAIVFIEDTKEIWNHGTYFDGSNFDPSNIEETLNELATAISDHQDVTDALDAAISNKADKTEIPTKLSQLENDSNYIQDDVVANGVYAVTTDEKLIDYTTANDSCIGVALVAGEHKFMIAKADTTDGTNTTLYWGKNLYRKDVAGITNISSGGGYIGEGEEYGTDFTTWSTGPVVDFNGAANTAAIIAGYTEHGVSMDARDICTVLNTFNASDSHNDWYVPALGQLALMYLNMTEINAALAKIGGTAIKSDHSGFYWSSSEYDADKAWYMDFGNSVVSYDHKGFCFDERVRFVRDISVSKSLKERVDDLESSNCAYKEINHGTGDTTFTLTPNTFHVWDEVASLDLSFADEQEGVANEYLFQFTSGATATTLTLPDGLKWANDSAPTIAENMIYQVSVLKGLASVLEFSNPIVFPIVSLSGSYPEVYSYFTTQYTFPSTSTKPSSGILISEELYIEGDDDISGKVIKIGFDGSFLVLWTESSLNSYYVLRMSSSGLTDKYFWD